MRHIAVLAAAAVWLSVEAATAQPAVLTNERVVEGLRAPLDATDERAVLRAVLRALPDEVHVGPTENYYYFRLWAGGREISGSLALPARSRDDGVLSLGYRSRDAGAAAGEWSVGGGRLLSAADGVRVRRAADLVYDVSFEGRTVRFRLNPTELAPLEHVPLDAGESYVGPVEDESGLAFHLLFDPAGSRLFLVLDEREPPAEHFRPGEPGIEIGDRTGFAFWSDPDPPRRILIGVAGEHVLANDWLDGPFDQMPDNAVRKGRIPAWRDILEAAYPGARGHIDQYGYYVAEPGTRVAVAPYRVYFDERDLAVALRSCEKEADGRPALRRCLTHQVFEVPVERRASAPRKENPS